LGSTFSCAQTIRLRCERTGEISGEVCCHTGTNRALAIGCAIKQDHAIAFVTYRAVTADGVELRSLDNRLTLVLEQKGRRVDDRSRAHLRAG